jgi:DNA polymerase I-like protein with 3'-5' exonuclease and polymerase domains
VFGPASWLRGLIKPVEGTALAYIDYEQQEFGIAAALSQDPAMIEAYNSGDPYLAFAKQAGQAPTNATKETHADVRERFKHCALGVQYGMRERSLAIRLGVSNTEAQNLLRLHKATYERYWRWSKEVGRQARKNGKLRSAFGWTLNVRKGSNPRSVRNFLLQANGAEMLRLACWKLTEDGVRVCAPIHDAVLIEADENNIDQAVRTCQDTMAWASEQVLKGFTLRTEAKIIRYPDRFVDARGKGMWDMVFDLLDREQLRVSA